MKAKYIADDTARKVLLLTRDAILTHSTRGVAQHEEIELMQVRSELMEEKDSLKRKIELDDSPENKKPKIIE